MEIPRFQFQDLQNRIGKGVKSRVFAIETEDGPLIVKVLKRPYSTFDKAFDVAYQLQSEYESYKDYLEPYVPESELAIIQDSKGRYRVLTVQEPIEGISFKDGIEKAIETDRTEHIETFLAKGIRMREETGIIPDLRGTRKVIGWWFPSKTKNVLVEIGEDGSLVPKLLDVNFISGEHLGIQYAHPFFHTKAIKKLLKSLG